MKLSQMERLILVNQYLILENLYPEDARDYALIRRAIECGYESRYCEAFKHLCPDNEVLSEAEGERVHKILDMFRALKCSYNKLDDKAGIEPKKVALWGFDGNNESVYMGYARYLIEDCQAWGELREDAVFNRHLPSLSRYNRMLEVWNSYGNDKYMLSKEQILSIIEP